MNPLPDEALAATALHVVDTVAAMVSGSRLLAGRRGADLARALGGPPEAHVIGIDGRYGMAASALANGMSAHADETDDSHAGSLSHPGCAVVPAALAAANRWGAGGQTLLRAVCAGYDVGCRVGRALGMEAVDLRLSRPSSHHIVGTFGAAAAAAVVLGADAVQCAHVLSYAAQQATGVNSWQRDPDHVEKAFDFAGSPALSGVLAALAVSVGCTGVDDVFIGLPNYLDAVSGQPRPGELAAELGSRFEVTETNIKRYSVGSPAQAAVQAAEEVIARHRPDLAAVARIEISLPAELAGVVDGRPMPDVNVQYLVAGTLLDGACTFRMSHDTDRMSARDVQSLMRRTSLRADESRASTRSAEVRLVNRDGSHHAASVQHVKGTIENPMTEREVHEKAVDVMSPIIGVDRSWAVVRAVEGLAQSPDLGPLHEALEMVGSRD